MMTLRDILAGLGTPSLGAAVPDRVFAHITQDSREIQPGDLFVARRGEAADGHAFIADAIRRGASGVLAERLVDTPSPLTVFDARPGRHTEPSQLSGPENVAYMIVPDSHKGLEGIAAWWRQQLPVDVVGITGSVGKTSTKELTAAVLSRRYRVLKSERSLNTDVGMALTLLQLDRRHQMAVLEMGMYAKGEIAHLCELAGPRIGVVTNVGPTHLARMGSVEAIADAKAELVKALPAGGMAILNGDDPYVGAMRQRTRAKVFTFGNEQSNDLWAGNIESYGLDGIAFQVHQGGETRSLRLALPGRHSVLTALAAAAVGLNAGLTWPEIGQGLEQVAGQLRLVVTPGVNGSTIIDDSYNSSPVSCLAALDLLGEMNGRRVAVLGDMLELGSYEDEGHRQVGRRAAQVADLLLAVGERGRIIGDEASRSGMPANRLFFAANNGDAVTILTTVTQAGDFVLVKGSRGMRMEEIVARLRKA